MVIYNAEDKKLQIPNGIGNLNLTINSGGGGDTPDLSNYATTQYVDEEILKVNSEIETINEDIDVLEGRIIDLENNGGTGGGGSSVVRITAIDETISVEDFNRIFDNTNNEVFEVSIQYTNKEDNTIITIIKKGSITDYGVKNIVGYDDTTMYKWIKYSFDDNIIYFEKSSISCGGDTTELEYRVTELEDKTFNNANSLENQIEALVNRTDSLENRSFNDFDCLQNQILNLKNDVDNLEVGIYLFNDENYTLSPSKISLAKADLKTGKRVVLNNYFLNSETLFEVIGYDEYEINDEWYTSISAIKGDYLYIWSTEFESTGNVKPQKKGINSTGGGGSSVVRIVAMNEILSLEDFNRIFDNPNNELFELQFKYSNNDNYKTFTILCKEYDSMIGAKIIYFFDFMQKYKFLKYSFEDTIYMESGLICDYIP